MNVNTFDTSYFGTFVDTIMNGEITGGLKFDNRFITATDRLFYTSKLYGQTSGVNGVKISGLSVYPNPAVGTVNVSLPKAGKIEVYSVTGALRLSQQYEAGNAQVTTLPGVNIIKVAIGNQVQTFQVLGL
jgi:hypothetical protein